MAFAKQVAELLEESDALSITQLDTCLLVQWEWKGELHMWHANRDHPDDLKHVMCAITMASPDIYRAAVVCRLFEKAFKTGLPQE